MQSIPSLNRKQKRDSERIFQKLRQNGTPCQKLATEARDILHSTMINYGNVLSAAHEQALLEICDLYSNIIFGHKKGRFVVPLQCGLGKSLSVLAIIIAIHNMKQTQRSVLVCQSRISELCIMKTALIKAGVPPEKIGLVHSYTYDPLATVVDGVVLNADGTTRAECAALPSNATNENGSDFQFLLCSHSRVQGRDEITAFTHYKGNPRSLNLWDEGLVSTSSSSIRLGELNSAITILENDNRLDLSKVAPLVTWLKASYQLLITEEAKQRLGSQASSVSLQQLTSADHMYFSSLAKAKAIGRSRGEWRGDLEALLGMSKAPVRVSIAGGESVVQYQDAVSRELTNLVVLDASYIIRQLVRLDPTLQDPKFYVLRETLKSYSDVTLHRLNYYGSRDAAENPQKLLKVATEIALVIKDIPVDQAICLFTFLNRDSRKPSHANGIQRVLMDHGVDLKATVTLPDGSNKPRFVWKTWGEHTGANNASYCENLFMAGVLRQPEDDFTASLIGQTQNLLSPIDSEVVSEAMISECAHVVYQASLRSRARMVSCGKALSANLYLVFNDARIEHYLKEAMKGVVIKEWIPKDEFFKGSDVTGEVAKKMILAFEDLTQGSINSISVSELKKSYGFTEVADKTFQLSRDQALLASTGWQLEGRSFKRLFPAVTQ